MKKFIRNFYPFQQNLFNIRKSISLLSNMYRYRRNKITRLQNPLPRFPTLFNDKLLNPKNNNLLNLNINFGMQQKSYFSTSNIHSSSTSSSSSTTGRNDDTNNEYENFLVLKKLLQSKRVSLSFISLSELLMKTHGMKIPTKFPSNRYDIKNTAFKNNQLVLANHNQEKENEDSKENKQHQNVTNNISRESDKHLRTKHLSGPFTQLYIPVVLVDDPEEIIVVHEDDQKNVNQTNQITELDSIQDDVELMTLEEIINFPEYRRSQINNIQEFSNQFHKQANNTLNSANISPGDEIMNNTINEDEKQLREFSILSQFDALIIAAAANAKNKIFHNRSRQLTSNTPPVLIGSSPMSTKSKIEGTETEDVCSSGTLFQSYKAINAKNKISIIKQGICAEQPSQETKSEISAEKSANQRTKAMDDWKTCGGKDSKSTTITSAQKKENHKTPITQTINAEKNYSSPCTAPKKQEEKKIDAKAKEILKKEEKKDSKPCNSTISSSSTSKAKTDTQSPRSTCVKKEAKQTNDGKTDSKSVTAIEKEKNFDKKITCEKTKPEIKLTLDTCKTDKIDCSKVLTEPKLKPAQSVSAYEKSNKNEKRVQCGSKKRTGTLKFCSEYEKTEKISRHTKSFIIKVSDVNNNLTSVEVIPGESSEISKYSSHKSSDQRIILDGGTGTQKEVIIEIEPPAKLCIRSKQKVDGTKPPSIGSGTNNSKSGTKKFSCIPDSKLNNSKSKAPEKINPEQMRYNTKKYSTLLNANYLATNIIPGFGEMPPINHEYGSILYNIFNSSRNSSIFTSGQNFENLSAAQTANFIPTNLISSLLILAVTTFHKLNYRLKSIFKSKFDSGNSRTFSTTSVKDKIDCQTKTTIVNANKCDDNAVNKTVTITGCRELKVIDCPIPKIGDYDVLIKVDTCGITGADLYMYQTKGENCKNIILGYEAAGIIEKAGKCVSHLKIGDHAVIEPGVCCGLCHFCKTGKYNLCLHTIYLGTMGTYAAYTGDFCHKLPKQINMEDGALVHPVALALHAIFKAKVCPKSRVLVIGSCPVALSSIACAKAMNASKVSIVDEIRKNLELAASKFGADHAILVQSQMTTDDMYKCILDQIKCHPNVVIITSGCSKAFSLAIKCCDYGGTIILAGCHTQCASVNILQILNKEIKIESSFRSRNTFPAAIDLISRGNVQPSNFIAHRIPFNNVKDAFETALDSCKESLKVVLKFQNTSSSTSVVSKTTDNLQKKS